MIELSQMSYTHHDKTILHALSISIKQGEKVVLLGVNGSGKSTLLRLLNGLIFPTQGYYKFHDKNVDKETLSHKSYAYEFRQKTAFLFQNVDMMLFNKTVYEEIMFTPDIFNTPLREEKTQKMLDVFGLNSKKESIPFLLSGGEKQRVALASVCVHEPELLLLDEPTSALDMAMTASLVDYLSSLTHTTVITSTHSLSLASELGERAIVLKEGHIIFDGSISDFLHDEESLKRAGFVHTHRYHSQGVWHTHS